MFKFIKNLFCPEYVYLVHHDGKRQKKRAIFEGFYWYSTPYLPHTTCTLLPNGKVAGQCYIQAWEPITKGVAQYYLSDLKSHLSNQVKKITGIKL